MLDLIYLFFQVVFKRISAVFFVLNYVVLENYVNPPPPPHVCLLQSLLETSPFPYYIRPYEITVKPTQEPTRDPSRVFFIYLDKYPHSLCFELGIHTLTL